MTQLSPRRLVLGLHRWLSIGAALFWLVQAVTGVLIMFHWELRDASISSFHRDTDLTAIERRIAALAPAGSGRTVKSVWTTAGMADRYDVNVADTDGTVRAVRIAGDGTVLHREVDGEAGILDTLVSVHHDLWGGELGGWIVGISGILLASNLAMGLVVAWPKGGRWRGALRPTQKGGVTARLYAWHRALGLWVAIPALLLVMAGTMLKFEDGVAELVGAQPPPIPAMPPPPAGGPPADDAPVIGFAAAVRGAMAALPGSRLTAVAMPTATDAVYRVRLLAPGEWRRAYGTSMVFVAAATGDVHGVFPAREAPLPRAFVDMLYAIHTGESGGLVGRVLVLGIGLWLASMVVVGMLLWLRRRPRTA